MLNKPSRTTAYDGNSEIMTDKSKMVGLNVIRVDKLQSDGSDSDQSSGDKKLSSGSDNSQNLGDVTADKLYTRRNDKYSSRNQLLEVKGDEKTTAAKHS